MKESSTNTKHILVLASTFPRWEQDSTPPFVLELEKRLANDFTISILAPHAAGAKLQERKSNLLVNRFRYFWPEELQLLCYNGGILPNLKKNKLLYIQAITLLISEWFAAMKLIRNTKPQLIHAHWIIPQGIIALLVKKFFHISYIVTTHGGDIFGLQNGLLKSMKKEILKNATAISVVSTAIEKEMRSNIDASLPITVISMGVDGKLFHPNNYSESLKKTYNITGPFLLFVGRLAEKKGVKYLLQAMPEILNKFPTTKLLIIGEGTERKRLESLAKELRLTNSIIFLGGIPNNELPQFYATADIFIGPSIQTQDGDTEGLGLTFVEAAFSECIPIGTNIGGISDVITKETGFLVRAKNSGDIAQTVTTILHSPKKMERLKKKAREETLKLFDWNIITQKYKQLYSV